MDQQDPDFIKTEVKIEIDIAEEPPQSWYMTESHPHVSNEKDVSTENTASLLMRCPSQTQALPCKDSGICVKPEVSTENTANLPMGQTLETQVVPSHHSSVWVKPEIREHTESLPNISMGQTTDMQTSRGCHSNICQNQEMTEYQCNKTRPFNTDVKPGKVWTGNCLVDCETEEDAQGIVNTVDMKQDKREHSMGMLACNVDVAGIQGRDRISSCKVEFINTQVCVGEYLNCTEADAQEIVNTVHMKQDNREHYTCKFVCNVDTAEIQRRDGSCEVESFNTQVHMRNVGEALNYTEAKRTSDVQLFSTVQPTSNCRQRSTSAVCSEIGRSEDVDSIPKREHPDDSCVIDHEKDVRYSISTCKTKKEKHHTCQLCDTKFARSSNLKCHMMIHTGQKPHACQQCDAKFTRPSHLKNHMIIHTGQKPHTCQQCDAKFIYSSSLKRHMLIHTGQKPHACQQCDAKFIYSCNLKIHMFIHTGHKPYACQQCDAKFIYSSNLKIHMLIHTGQKPYVCQQCDAKFNQSSHLNRHKLMHTGQKSHPCQQCQSKFTQSSNLKRHMLIHTGQKSHACQKCDAKFTRSSNLKRHMLIHTRQETQV